MNGEQIELRFKELFNTNQKIQAVREFKDLTGLGLREAKEFIDDKWRNNLGINVGLYLLKTKGYISTAEITKGTINLQIEVIRNINESQIDELIEQLTIKIAELKEKK